MGCGASAPVPGPSEFNSGYNHSSSGYATTDETKKATADPGKNGTDGSRTNGNVDRNEPQATSKPQSKYEVLDKQADSATEHSTASEAAAEGPAKSKRSRGDVNEGIVAASLRAKRKGQQILPSASVVVGAAYVRKRVPKGSRQQSAILEALKQNALTASLSENSLYDIMQAMQARQVSAGDVIIRQGEEGDNFYVIDSGKYDIDVNGSTVAQFSRESGNASFGELALIYNSPRAATVSAATDGVLFFIDRETFRGAVANARHEEHQRLKRTLRRGILEELEDDQIDAIAHAATVHRYQAGAHIIKKGTPGEVFYIIEEGSVVCKNIGGKQNNNRLTAGDYVGERALLTAEPRAADVFAEEDSVLVALSREDFENILGHLRELLEHNMGMRLLLCVPILSQLPTDDRQKLFGSLTLVSFEPGQMVAQQDIELTHFFIIKEGTALVCQHDAEAASRLEVEAHGTETLPGQPIPYDTKGDADSPLLSLYKQYAPYLPEGNAPMFCMDAGRWFGEVELQTGEPPSCSVIAVTPLQCFVLDKESFEKLLVGKDSLLQFQYIEKKGMLGQSSNSAVAAASGSSVAGSAPTAGGDSSTAAVSTDHTGMATKGSEGAGVSSKGTGDGETSSDRGRHLHPAAATNIGGDDEPAPGLSRNGSFGSMADGREGGQRTGGATGAASGGQAAASSRPPSFFAQRSTFASTRSPNQTRGYEREIDEVDGVIGAEPVDADSTITGGTGRGGPVSGLNGEQLEARLAADGSKGQQHKSASMQAMGDAASVLTHTTVAPAATLPEPNAGGGSDAGGSAPEEAVAEGPASGAGHGPTRGGGGGAPICRSATEKPGPSKASKSAINLANAGTAGSMHSGSTGTTGTGAASGGTVVHAQSTRPGRERERESAGKSWQRLGIPLAELKQCATLGTGSFGRVRLVHHEASGRAFALKILHKSRIVELRQERNIMSEKKVLMALRHPFAIRLHDTYRDRNCLYMLLELVQGGELFSRMQDAERDGRLDEAEARFYCACVTDVLDHLHRKHILYRDIKPENMLIDTQGYLKVCDFGFAKVTRRRTHTMCGTPEYLAPELVLSEGHSSGVDWWALGVLLFEMLAGYSPFNDGDDGDQVAICRNIIRGTVDFPAGFGSDASKDVVRKLLTRDPHRRLGCLRGGGLDVQRHAFFSSVDWVALRNKRIPAPWVPQVAGKLDTRHFDEYDEDDSWEPYAEDGSGWDAKF